MLQRSLAGALDDRSIRYGIAERHAYLDHVCACTNRRQRDLTRYVQTRVAAGDVGHQTRALFEDDCQIAPLSSLCSQNAKFSRKIPISLSPRPDTFTITMSDLSIFGARLMHSAIACADSSAGMMPSIRASFRHASSAS